MATGTHAASFLLFFPFLSFFTSAPGICIERMKEGGGGWPQIQGEGSVLALDETTSALRLAGRRSHQRRLCGSCTAHES